MKKFLFLICAILLLVGCKTQYIPVEKIKTEYKTQYVHDSIVVDNYIHDSISVKEKGDTMWIERWHTKYRDRWHEIIKTDTVLKTDSIPVPYPVPAEMTMMQKFYCGAGGYMIGALILAIIIIIYLFRHRLK